MSPGRTLILAAALILFVVVGAHFTTTQEPQPVQGRWATVRRALDLPEPPRPPKSSRPLLAAQHISSRFDLRRRRLEEEPPMEDTALPMLYFAKDALSLDAEPRDDGRRAPPMSTRKKGL
uniref:Uncharacterized protein n=1 Tax=Mycena chlorophos TaxID=658473 RepID=A0ABQ0LY46_MYCCL|nr:predicted protein [Mycena chlorophos]